jgi:hypothetical protein
MDVMEGPLPHGKQKELNKITVISERSKNKYRGKCKNVINEDHHIQPVLQVKRDEDISVNYEITSSSSSCESRVSVTTNGNECSDKRISEIVYILEKDESPWVNSLPVTEAINASYSSSHIVIEKVDNVIEQERTGTKDDVNPNLLVNTLKTDEITWKEGSAVNTNDTTKKLKNGKNLFKIFHQNIRGIKSKASELLNSLISDYPQIICITEHHLKDYEIDKLPIEHYILGSKYCRQNHKNGGVCIYVHEDLEFFRIPLEKYCVEKDIEICALKLTIAPIHITILVTYRSPSGNFNNFMTNLDTVLNLCYNNNSILVICGDININYLDNCMKRQQLDALLLTYNLKGTVTFPTHITNTSSTAIDNIFLTKTSKYTIAPYTTGLSDHEAQILTIENVAPTRQRKNSITVRDINDQNIREFQLQLSYENWEDIFAEEDANVSFNKFLNTYLRIFQSCFTKKHKNVNIIPKPWLTAGIKTSCKRKRELYLIARDSMRSEPKIYYKHYCKILTKVLKEAKKIYYKDIINRSKNKIKTTWNIIHKETMNQPDDNNIKSLKINNYITQNQKIIANEINDYFLNIAKITNTTGNNANKENSNPIQYLFKYFHQPFKNIRWTYTSSKEINKIINSLKNKHSSGYDEITTKIIKISKHYIISPIINISNKMLSQGVYPERLKFALIKPIYKNGDKSSPSNYRPISLLPAFSKIFEKLIYERLFDHLGKNTILSEHQYGFRKDMSTENASYMLLNDILTAMNSKQIVGGIFCDLQKAFDCINHEVLLKKLEFYGVTMKFYNLIKSYLDGRYQKVVINSTTGAESNWEKIKQGVPQGSILGPILFLIYINDLPKLAPTGTKILLYADDTSIIVTSPNLTHYEIQINEIFKEVNYWFKLNKLKLNFNKTHYLQFTPTTNRMDAFKINLQGPQVNSSSHTKFLGLIVDDSLSWKDHIDQMRPKLNSACFVIRSLQAMMDIETLKIIYFAYVHSIVSYGIIFWGNQLYSDKIFKIQKRAVRIITNSRTRDSCRKLFQRLEILPLYSQYIFSISLFVVKNKHLYNTNNLIHGFNTRQKTNLHQPTANLTKYQKGVYYSGVKIFNNLPKEIKDLTNQTTPFRNSLKRFLLLNCFYNREEYFNYSTI